MESIYLLFSRSKYRLFWHVLFWFVILLYYTLFFGHQQGFYWETLKFVAILLPISAGTSYLFNYYLIPKFLVKGKIKTFILLSAYALIVSFWMISLIIFPFLVISKSDLNMATLDKSILDVYFLVVGLYTATLVAILIKLTKISYERHHLHMQLLKEKTEAELEALRSQINPHFLFNTLNNIHTLASKKSNKTPEVVMKLSEMLDYLLYECRAEKVPLKKEIQLIQNYLYLQEMRFHNRLKIQFETQGEIGTQEIAPMLLLPFVENSFKHGAKRSGAGWIKVRIDVNSDGLEFSVRNSNPSAIKNPNNRQSGGIGIDNVRKRLDMLYGNAHELLIEEEEQQFIINLKVMTAA